MRVTAYALLFSFGLISTSLAANELEEPAYELVAEIDGIEERFVMAGKEPDKRGREGGAEDVSDVDAGICACDEQTAVLQFRDSFAQGRAGDAETLGQFALGR